MVPFSTTSFLSVYGHDKGGGYRYNEGCKPFSLNLAFMFDIQGGPAKVATLSGPAKVATFLAQQKWPLFGSHIKCSFHPLNSGPFLSNTRTFCGLVASMITDVSGPRWQPHRAAALIPLVRCHF